MGVGTFICRVHQVPQKKCCATVSLSSVSCNCDEGLMMRFALDEMPLFMRMVRTTCNFYQDCTNYKNLLAMAATKVCNYCDDPGFTNQGPGAHPVTLSGKVHHFFTKVSSSNPQSCGFGTEHMDNRLCKNCNNSNTSEVTTSIHTHPDVLIIMLQHNCWNNNSERINTRVNFPLSGFVPNQGLDNDEMPMEYDLFAAVCHKESRNKTSEHFTAQCKIKGSNGYWIKYNDQDFELNNFINSRNRTRTKVKYHPFAYFLIYIRRDPAVSPEIGLQESPERRRQPHMMTGEESMLPREAYDALECKRTLHFNQEQPEDKETDDKDVDITVGTTATGTQDTTVCQENTQLDETNRTSSERLQGSPVRGCQLRMMTGEENMLLREAYNALECKRTLCFNQGQPEDEETGDKDVNIMVRTTATGTQDTTVRQENTQLDKTYCTSSETTPIPNVRHSIVIPLGRRSEPIGINDIDIIFGICWKSGLYPLDRCCLPLVITPGTSPRTMDALDSILFSKIKTKTVLTVGVYFKRVSYFSNFSNAVWSLAIP